MWWKGPDQTEILVCYLPIGIAMGNEIPVEKRSCSCLLKQKLADAEQYASTDHLLMMNGVIINQYKRYIKSNSSRK